MGLRKGLGLEGELKASGGRVRSPLTTKEAALVVGRLNTNNFLLEVDFRACAKETSTPAFQLAKLRCFHVSEETLR